MYSFIKSQDSQVSDLITKEIARQKEGLVMIPSENYASLAVLEALGTPLTNKYSEGYAKKRYYSGNEFVDQIELLAIERAKQLFHRAHANVQPHSGSTANQSVFFALLEIGDKILSLDLKHGGHLTHGSPVNFSGKLYQIIHYGVEKDTEMIDYEKLRETALYEKPKLIISGTTAYPREIDFEKISAIAKECGAIHLADISHIAGLIIAGVHKNCAGADVVTTTTHKTLRGPRGAIILCNEDLAEKIDKAVFPGTQGGPLDHVIAAKAVAFQEAMQPSFIEYQKQIVKNAQTLAKVLSEKGLRLVSGGTNNHLILIDLTPLGISGGKASDILEEAGIYVNKNSIPFDENPPYKPSGIRLGTPALTTRGMGEEEMEVIGELISDTLQSPEKASFIKQKVLELTDKFPIYKELS